jgi:hypothetical protein
VIGFSSREVKARHKKNIRRVGKGALYLVLALAVLLQLIGLDGVYELMLEMVPPLIFQGFVAGILKSKSCRFWPIWIRVLLTLGATIPKGFESSSADHIRRKSGIREYSTRIVSRI